MENISLSIINLRTNRESALAVGQVYLNKSPTFQRTYEAWDDKLKTRLIETILLGRAMNPIWTILNSTDGSEEILDGMHRLSTALSYLNNEFKLSKTYFTSLDGEKYNSKKFCELTQDDQAKIRNYNFVCNKLDSSYHQDKNKLKDMYEILNRSSKALNDYEFNKVLLQPFYDIIAEKKQEFSDNDFFKRIPDMRGSLETEIIEILVLSEEKLPSSWSSITSLKEKWVNENLGSSDESISAYLVENKKLIVEKLNFILKIINAFISESFYPEDKRTLKKYYLPHKFIISRCCVFFLKNFPLFNRHYKNLIQTFNQRVTGVDIQTQLGDKTRNAVFQKKLIQLIDDLIKEEVGDFTRTFTKTIIQTKMKLQDNVCPECKHQIKEKDDYHAHHIKSWTSGGSSTIENCSVLHKRCHELLHSK